MNIIRANIVLSIIHALLAVSIGSILISNDFDIDLELRKHTIVNSNSTPIQTWSSVEGMNMNNYIKYGLIFFYVWTSLAHTLYAINPNEIYTKSIKNYQFPLRWIEYAVSATVMLGIMAIISGVKDEYTFYLLLFSSVAIMSTGYWYETTQTKLPILLGFFLLIGVSVVIISSFNQRLDEATSRGVNIPGFVYGVVYIMLFFYSIFGFVPLVSQKNQEYYYMVLSLIAKTTLGLLLAMGVMNARN